MDKLLKSIIMLKQLELYIKALANINVPKIWIYCISHFTYELTAVALK
jgi:hypothetical protein